MRAAFLTPFLAPLVGVLAMAQAVQLPDVVDRTLGNGMKVLLVERPGAGAVQVRLFLQGGRANTGGLPSTAADLLARTLFTRLLPEELDHRLAPSLEREGGAFEALRLERLRGARQRLAGPSDEFTSLKAMHGKAMATIQETLGAVASWDALDALGATGRETVVTADFIAHGLDLPAKAFLPWCQLEADLLRRLPLGRFPLEREGLVREIEEGRPPLPPALSVVLATALSGHPYSLAADFQRSGVEALAAADLTGYGRWLTQPERLTLVVVGDIQRDPALKALEHSFGALGKGAAGAAWNDLPRFKSEDPIGVLESPGGRHLTVSTTGDTRIFFAWRLPPVNHPDGPALRALAQVLAGSASARLNQALTGPRGVARRLSLRLGVPGERDANLLVIEAEPGEGHSLAELEQAIQGEVLRLQREPLGEAEVRRAQTQLEAAQLTLQEDAAVLAGALGAAHCQGGEWKVAFRALEAGRDLRPAEIQVAARSYLVPARVTVVQLGPDPLLLPMDRTESRMLQVLTALVQPQLGSPAKVQEVLREALRQMRMLSPAEREQTLRLLEAQVAK